MNSLNNLIEALDELTVTRRISTPHDEARMRYSPQRNTVGSFQEFTSIIADYYNYHFSECISHGGSLSRTDASGRAKEILEQVYRRERGDLNTAYNDAHDGTNGGLRVILDRIAEHLKAESVERYTREAFDRFVEPNSWEQKVVIIRQFIARYGHQFSSSINPNQPERYAQNYQELIREYLESLKRTSSIFRRI
ncbi:hypothetical protein ACFL0Q_01035 [Thermodesulfobacteriota bacterium]